MTDVWLLPSYIIAAVIGMLAAVLLILFVEYVRAYHRKKKNGAK